MNRLTDGEMEIENELNRDAMEDFDPADYDEEDYEEPPTDEELWDEIYMQEKLDREHEDKMNAMRDLIELSIDENLGEAPPY